MKKNKLVPIIATCTIVVIIATIGAIANSIGSFDNRLKSIGDGMYIQEDQLKRDEEGNKVGEFTVAKAYSYENSKFIEADIKQKTVSIMDMDGNEKSITFSLIEREGKPIKVKPYDLGSLSDFSQVGDAVVFSLDSMSGLYYTTTSLDNVINLQPDIVGNYSRTELLKTKESLASEGIDTDGMLLYWVSGIELSPDGKNVLFGSNRSGYPNNKQSSTIWITDLSGNTELLVDEGDKVASSIIGWINDSEFLYRSTDIPSMEQCVKLYSITDKQSKPIFETDVEIDGYAPGGKYILYRKIINNKVDKECFRLDTETWDSLKVDIPEGFRPHTTAVWNDNNTDAAFFVMNEYSESIEIKFFTYNCETGLLTEISPPYGYKLDDTVFPSWQDNNVIYSAEGKTFVAKITEE